MRNLSIEGASSVGVYLLWRDSSYAVVAVLADVIADLFGFASAIAVVGILTAISAFVVAIRMRETLSQAERTKFLYSDTNH